MPGNLVIVPMAGRSTRFPAGRPKWMLTHPMGNLMFYEAIRGLDMPRDTEVRFVIWAAHERNFNAKAVIERQLALEPLEHVAATKIQIVDETRSQPETVARSLIADPFDGPVFIKDCDNRFKATVDGTDSVAVADMSTMRRVHVPGGKSYVEIGGDGPHANDVLNIAEKQIISPWFCVGGYSFASADAFLRAYAAAEPTDTPFYVSHMIYYLMTAERIPFSAQVVAGYRDWGTYEAWEAYKASFGTVFVDVDGVLLTNTGRYWKASEWGDGKPIEDNANYVNHLYYSQRVRVVLTTARPETERRAMVRELRHAGISYHDLLMGLPHGVRVVINDAAPSNTRAAAAVTLPRDSDKLRELVLAQGLALGEL